MTKTTIIDGKAIAEDLCARVAAGVELLKSAHDLMPGLAVVSVGEDAASQVYVKNKAKQTMAGGMAFFDHRLAAETSQTALLELIVTLNGNVSVHGILVQLPLPPCIDADAILNIINPAKDVDGFHPMNVGRLASGGAAMAPCTPRGCVILAKHVRGDLTGLEAVVIGRSNIVGKPLAQLLLNENCTVTITHSRTRSLAAAARRADLLIVAVGRPRLVTGDWIKPGAAVIDVGINRIDAGAGKTMLVGDVDFESAQGVAGAITPVPGGVGPMTIACLLANTLEAACAIEGVEMPQI